MKFKVMGDSCNIDDKGSSCCTPAREEKNLKEHWNKAYLSSPDEELSWYEAVPEETICLIEKCNLSPDSVILNVGAGLPVHRYSTETLAGRLGNDFRLVGSFDHIFFMPSGAERPYVYTLFRKR